MQHLIDLWVEAGAPLRGWKVGATERGSSWSTGLIAAVPTVNAKALKHESLERVWFKLSWSPGDGICEKATAAGFVLLRLVGATRG